MPTMPRLTTILLLAFVGVPSAGRLAASANQGGMTLIASIQVGRAASGVVVVPGTHRAYVADGGGDGLAVVDGAALVAVARLAVGGLPGDGPSVDPRSGRVYVPSRGNGTVAVIEDFDVVATIHGFAEPRSVAVHPGRERLYVADGTPQVSVVDLASHAIVDRLGVDGPAHHVAVDAGSDRLVVATSTPDAVVVVDLANGARLLDVSAKGIPTIDPVDGLIYVANADAAAIDVLDVGRPAERRTIARQGAGGMIAINARARCLYATNSHVGRLDVVALGSGSIIGSYDWLNAPHGVAVDEAAGLVYVADSRLGAVSVLRDDACAAAWQLPTLTPAPMPPPTPEPPPRCPPAIAASDAWDLPSVPPDWGDDAAPDLAFAAYSGYLVRGTCQSRSRAQDPPCRGALTVFDLDAPRATSLRGQLALPGAAPRAVASDGRFAYVLAESSEPPGQRSLDLWAIDVREGAAPRASGTIRLGPWASKEGACCALALGSGMLFVGGPGGVDAYRLDDPAAPLPARHLDAVGSLALSAGTLFVAGTRPGRLPGVWAFDVGDPQAPIEISYTPRAVDRVKVLGDLAVIANEASCWYSGFDWTCLGAIEALDVSDVRRPVTVWGPIPSYVQDFAWVQRLGGRLLVPMGSFIAFLDLAAADRSDATIYQASEASRIEGVDIVDDRLLVLERHSDGGTRLREVRVEAYRGNHPTLAASSHEPGWLVTRLVDGQTGQAWSSGGHAEHLAGSEWAAVVLAEPAAVDELRMRPRRNADDPAWAVGFPEDLVLQFADPAAGQTCDPADARFAQPGNWRALTVQRGLAQPAPAWQAFRFEARIAGCVRVWATELGQDPLGQRVLQLADIDVKAAGRSLALSAAAASSTAAGWPANHLVDGREETVWSSASHPQSPAETEWVAAVFGARSTVSAVSLGLPTERRLGLSGLPEDLVVQYAIDGGDQACRPEDPRFALATNWRSMASREGLPGLPFAPERFRIDFAPREADCVRVVATELDQDDAGNRVLMLGAFIPHTAGWVSQYAASSVRENHRIECLGGSCGSEVFSSRVHDELRAGAEWVAVSLNHCAIVDAVRLTPRRRDDHTVGFPEDVVIQGAVEGAGQTCDARDARFTSDANWTPLAARSGLPEPLSAPLTLGFARQPVHCIRLLASELGQDDAGVRRLQLDELELLYDGQPVAPVAPPPSVLWLPVAFGG